MAKRKRLTPAQPAYFNTTARAPEVKSMSGADFAAPPIAPPIAQVASDAATRSALDEVTGALQDARHQGRLIEALPLAAIDARYLVRDRLVQNDEDMGALMASLRARGQQTPIEVTALPGASDGVDYGLISGWRRLNALIRLYEETGEERFATIKALMIAPGTARDAYVAMVEENEIRVNLSLYERANIARRAAEEGIYPTPRHAVLGLFAATPRAKRSKIGSFVTLVQALDPVLRHPTAIPEKLGLDLARALAGDAGFAQALTARLKKANPRTVADELRLLSAAVSAARRADPAPALPPNSDPDSPAPAPPGEVAPGLRLRFDRGRHPRIELSGAQVNDALFRDLGVWLVARQDK